MKKDKIEIVLFIAAIIFAIAALFFYGQSKKTVLTAEIPYTESGSTSYKVHLNDSTYYNKDYLDEGMQYISSIIDYIDVNFNYNAEYDGIKSYKVNRNVVAQITITDQDGSDKVIYSKKEVLVEKEEELTDLNLSDDIKIDYAKYNGLVNDIKSKYGISANSMLKLEYNLAYSADNENIKASKKLSIDIPLSKQMINITKGDVINDSSVYAIEATDSVVNYAMFAIMLVMAFAGITCFSIAILRVRDRIKNESKYDRFINKVLKEYDSYITEASEDIEIASKETIKVNSFKELLDVRNNIDKTIVYTKIDENTSRFQIIDEEVYEYVVTRKEMEK